MPLRPPMQYSKTGLALTERFESCRLEAYQDQVGVWTIGWGHTKGVYEGMTCTAEQALQWLIQDTLAAATAVNVLVNVPVTQDEFDALTDFIFNLGAMAFASSTMLRLLNAGDYEGAAGQFERWDHAGGVEVAGLLRRRKEEEDLFDTSTPPASGTVT